MGHMVAQMVLAILYTSFAQDVPSVPEASLLQVSQAPALQAQVQGAQVAQPQAAVQVPPPAPSTQVVQPSVAVPTAVHDAYMAPAAMGAVATSASAGQVPVSVTPVQAALTATASGVKSAHIAQMNETALAFSQLSSLNTEFKELHADDASHVRQLMYNVHLREQLQEKLRQAGDQLAGDNEHLAERTMQIIAAGDPEPQPRKDESQPQGGENPSNETFAALLLEAAVVSRRNRERNNAQIAAQALDRVKQLVDDIAALRARDEQEIQALRANAENRNALRKKIEERDDQLHEDTNLLMKDLGSIRDLVSKDDVNAAGNAMEPAAASPKQDQQETGQSDPAVIQSMS